MNKFLTVFIALCCVCSVFAETVVIKGIKELVPARGRAGFKQVSPGVFRSKGELFILARRFFPVYPGKKYTISATVKQLSGTKKAQIRFGFEPQTVNRKTIHPAQVACVPGTETELVKPVKKGEKIIFVANGSKWKSARGDRIALFAEKDLSDLPNFDLVPARVLKAEKIGSEWKIRLSGAIPQDLPVKSRMRLHRSGWLHFPASGAAADKAKNYTAVLAGESASLESGKWPCGTRRARLALTVDFNSKNSDAVIEISDITIKIEEK